MKYLRILLIIIIAGIGAIWIFLGLFIVHIDVGEVGVRTLQYSLLGKKGVEERDFGPGWHRSIPMLDTWNVFDSTVQTTEFTTEEVRRKNQRSFSSRNQRSSRGDERIELKSKDGFNIQLDITVKYRIAEGKVHNMYRLFSTEDRYKRIVSDQLQDALRTIFGEMITEDFYNPKIRRHKSESASSKLREDLEKNYIDLVDLLIRDISFDPAYERKILDKKLHDQDVELNKSRALAEEKRGLTNKIEAETEAKVRVIEEEKKAAELTMKAEADKTIASIRAEAQVKVAKSQADADLFAAELHAKGTYLEKEADAKGELLKAQALKGSGGSNLVALEAIRELNLGNMEVSTLDTDFLDVEAMVEKLGAAE